MRRAERLEGLLILLVSLHSYAIGIVLLFATEAGLRFGGWSGDAAPLFFARQGGVFHLVVATGYLAEYARHRGVTLLLVAKATAMVFLVGSSLLGTTPWCVPLSGVADGLMGLVVVIAHRWARAGAAAARGA
jgi:hypothetical protein